MCLYGEPNWFGDKLLSFNPGGEVGLLPSKLDGVAASLAGGSWLRWSLIHTQWQIWVFATVVSFAHGPFIR